MAGNIEQAAIGRAGVEGGSRRRALWRTWPGRVLIVLVLILAAWLVWLARTGFAVGRDVRRLQSVAANPGLEALPALAQDVPALDRDLRQLRSAARPLLLAAPYLGWLPAVGPDIKAAPALLDMGVGLTGGGREVLEALPLADLLAERGQGHLLERLVPALAAARPRLSAAERQFASALAARASVHDPVSPRLAGMLAKLDRVLPLIPAGLQLAQAGPGLLGADGPRTYLILAQNNHELRATGGFISGAGIVRLEKGRITDLKIADSYAVDNFQQPHPQPPQPLAEQMGAQILLLRDSNWSPDFPTSAQVARSLYEQDQGVPTDGAIAFDLEAVRLLVGALGPLRVSGMPMPVTGDNLIEQMKQAWAQPNQGETPSVAQGGTAWFVRRKDFMGPLMTAALQQLLTMQGVRPVALATALLEMLNGRHVQIAVDDAEAAAILNKNRWDGALQLGEGNDFIAVVDSNLGFNKTNAAVRQAVDYQLLPADGGLTATLTLTYTHTAATLSGACDRSLRLADPTYDDMINRCHWEYLRVYVPGGSQLLDVQGLQNPGVDGGENGTTVFSGSFVLEPAHTQEVRLHYRLPPAVKDEPYRLQIRKQAGTESIPFRVRAGGCTWTDMLTRDRTLACSHGSPGEE